MTSSIPWKRYVAIGDSFTEGMMDELPDGTMRGWADLLALRLSHRRIKEGADPLLYANLAIRGRTLIPVIMDQLPEALDLKPDLVSIVAGGNDILRPNADIDRMAATLEKAVIRTRRTGADVLLAVTADGKGSPVIEMTRGRTAIFNSHLWTIAERHGARIINQWGLKALHSWQSWADDRIHLTPDGHDRVADAALVALGLPPERADYADKITQDSISGSRLEADVKWAKEYVWPWLQRRVRRQSSGDNRSAKLPDLTPIVPESS